MEKRGNNDKAKKAPWFVFQYNEAPQFWHARKLYGQII